VSATPALHVGFLGYAIRLAEPRALWLLAVVAVVAIAGAWALARRRGALARAAGPLAPRLAPAANTARPAARLGLSALALALLAIALARPQCGTRTELARRYGLDLVVVLDASRSMTARDVAPDRLSRATLEVGALLDGLSGDRVGVVVFAGRAFVQCPLTSDHAAAKLFLRAVGPDAIPQQGTSVGEALAAAREVLDAAERGARSKVVLLVSDGEDQEGGAAEAAAALDDAGIRVHALGVGTPAGGPIPLLDREGAVAGYKKDRGGDTVVTRLQEDGLRAIADAGGGEVFLVGAPGRDVAAFRATLERMEKSELESRLTVTYEDRYALAAFPAFLLLLASLLVKEARPSTSSPLPSSGHPERSASRQTRAESRDARDERVGRRA
jgi:Ca-activated chloride channel homolog